MKQTLSKLILTSSVFLLLSCVFPRASYATNSGPFSIDVWVNPTTSAATKALVAKAEELRLVTDASGNPACQIMVSSSWQTAATSSVALSLNGWNHVSCTYDKVTIRVYVNGVQTGTQALTTVSDDTANAFKIGQDDSSGTTYANFSGVIDDYKFYNYARSAKQVVEDMNAGHPSVGSPVGSAVGHWKFDEGADNMCAGGANDACNSGSAGSALDGPQTGMATPATATSGWTNSGKFNKALLFDGSNDYIAMGSDVTALKITSNIALSAWINLTNTSSQHDIICKYTGTAATSAYCLNVSSAGKLVMQVVNATGPAVVTTTSNTTLLASTWYHVVGVFNSAQNITLYINGTQDIINTTSIPTTLQDPTTVLDIGAENAGSNLFIGTIDEPKIYNYALTADEVKTEYNRGATLVLGSLGDNSSYQKQAANQEYCVPGDSTSCVTPLAEWKFDEGTSTTAFDSTGNGVKGTLVNSPAWIAGKVGKALNFNGSNSYVTTTDQDALFNTITTAMTISGWVKPAAGSLSSRRDLIQRAGAVGSINGATAAKDIWWFNLQNSGKMNFYMGGITGAYVETTTAISDSVWTYLTVTYDGTNIRFYINGKLDKTSAASGTLLTGDNGVGIGANLSTASVLTPFSGGIDTLRVWGYARSPAQIAYDYNRGAPVAQYKFDECTGATANDASGNNNTGTITIGGAGSQTSTGTCGTDTATEAWSNGTTGKRNASINLDGNDDYVSTSAFSPLATAAVTTTKASWGGWFYPTSSAASLTLMEKATEFRLTTDANSKPVCGIYYSAAFTDATAGSTALVLSSWNHVLCTYDGANIKTYLNGILMDTTANTNNITAASSILYMGENSSSAQRVTGQLDDIRVYNNALTPLQIKTLYNENSAVRFGPNTGSP